MGMPFGFSWVGALWLLMLFVPNILWTKNLPQGYSPDGENKILTGFERVGQVLTCICAVIFPNYNPRGWSAWTWWLVASAVCMVLYELWWVRYFRSKKTLADFYSSFCGIPVAGATLPVIAFFLLGIYGNVIWLMIAVVILGIGHIGIHLAHRRAL